MPRVGASSGPHANYYVWHWQLRQLQRGSYFQSGSTVGRTPGIMIRLNYDAHPTFYELYLIVTAHSVSSSTSCTDSIRLIVRGDTFIATSPRAAFCRDSIFLQLGRRSVQPGRSITLPLGIYPFSLTETGDFRGWWMTGPSPTQGRSIMRNYPAGTILDTIRLTAPGQHTLRIGFYNSVCWDTLTYIINAFAPSPTQNCRDTLQIQPCLPQLILNNSTYLPNPYTDTIRLVRGTYQFHLQPAHPLISNGATYHYEWRLSGGRDSRQDTSRSFAAYIDLRSHILEVRVRASWICPTTLTCERTYTFLLTGTMDSNDSVIVCHPGDTTIYHPSDTIPLPVDTTCIYGAIQVPHPDSVYYWNWIYYGPDRAPIDSGITAIACVYPTQPGVYSLVYRTTPMRMGRTRQHTFYLNFGARTTSSVESPIERLSLFPNPTTGTVYLTLPSHGMHRVTLLDPTGRYIESYELPGGQTHTLHPRLAAGLYLLRVESPQRTQLLRLAVTE